MTNHDKVTLGNIPKILIWAHLDSFGPLEASRGQTKHTMVGNKVVFDILEQVGSVQQAQKSQFTIISLWGHPENSDSGACWPLKASRGQTKHTMVEYKLRMAY